MYKISLIKHPQYPLTTGFSFFELLQILSTFTPLFINLSNVYVKLSQTAIKIINLIYSSFKNRVALDVRHVGKLLFIRV